MRILIYTGKGGAGKTTVAAATAVRCAELGRKTLLVGGMPQGALADCLDTPLGDQAAEISANLWAQELDPLARFERCWQDLRPLVGEGLAKDLSDVVTEELILPPEIGDLFRLLALKAHCNEDAFDVMVVDAGPASTALPLLAGPEAASWWLQRLVGPAGPISGAEDDRPLAGRTAALSTALSDLWVRLMDGAECSLRMVMSAEYLSIRETQRSLTFASLYGYNVDAIILNRQKRIPKSITDAFQSWPILWATLYDRDVIGQPLLSEMALALFPPPMDPAGVLSAGQAQRLAREEDGYVFSLKLPFIHEDDIDLLQHQRQLILQIGQMRRVLQLPPSLEGLQAAEALLEDGTLEVHFR